MPRVWGGWDKNSPTSNPYTQPVWVATTQVCEWCSSAVCCARIHLLSWCDDLQRWRTRGIIRRRLKKCKTVSLSRKGESPRRWHVIRTLCKKLTVDHRNSFCFWFLPHWRLLPVMFSDDVIPVESGVDVAGWSRGVRRSKKSRYNLLETTTCDSFVL